MLRDTKNVLGFGENRLIVIDWKWRIEAPTRAYLARNYQFYLYWLCCLKGKILACPWVDGWLEYGESPQMLWCHLPYLKPFKRKTTIKSEDGDDTVYTKGDERPIQNILRPVNYKQACANQMLDDLTERVNALRSGFYPKSADPIGCQICDAREFCTRGDTTELLEDT